MLIVTEQLDELIGYMNDRSYISKYLKQGLLKLQKKNGGSGQEGIRPSDRREERGRCMQGKAIHSIGQLHGQLFLCRQMAYQIMHFTGAIRERPTSTTRASGPQHVGKKGPAGVSEPSNRNRTASVGNQSLNPVAKRARGRDIKPQEANNPKETRGQSVLGKENP